MQRLYLVLIASCVLFVAGCQLGGDLNLSRSSAEDELRRIDLDQSKFVQAGDGQAMHALLHPSYTAHLPNGRLSSRAQTLDLIGSGSLAKERHQRMHEQVIVTGTQAWSLASISWRHRLRLPNMVSSPAGTLTFTSASTDTGGC